MCAGIFAAKTFDPLATRGFRPLYPFMEPEMVRLSLSLSYETRCPAGESKGLLKELLAESLPRDWIYRTKSGFVPPFAEIISTAARSEYVRETVLSSRNPLLGYFREDRLVELFEDAFTGVQPAPTGERLAADERFRTGTENARVRMG